MAITPLRDTDAVMLGLGELGLCPTSTSPRVFTSVGYIKGCTFKYTRELKDFESAGFLVKRLAFRDKFEMSADWAEASLTHLALIIPATTVGSPVSDMSFGGSRTTTTYSVRFEHTRSDAKVLTIDLYKGLAGGDFNFAFAEEAYITFPVQFSGQLDTSKPSGQQYGRMTLA